MRVATWNVNGIRARHSQVLEWIARDQPDVVGLQEIKASKEQVPESIACLPGYWCAWHGAGGYSGVALHFRRETFPVEPRVVPPPFDFETRMLAAEVDGTVFASVYVPNGGKDFAAKLRFLDAMHEHAASILAEGKSLVLFGDLNIAREERDVHPKERKPVIGQTPTERALLEKYLDLGVVDVGRALAPEDDEMFTWWAPWRQMRQRNIGWRLDYILASRALAERATACPVLRDVGTSDHAPVMATFA